MRIAILLNARFPTEKAYGIQVMAMARGFAQAGAEVAVVYPRRTEKMPETETGIRFIPYGPLMQLHRPWMFHVLRVLGAMQAVAPLRELKPDVVLTNDPVQAAYLAPKFPVVWDLHDLPNIHSAVHQWLMRRIVAFARGIVSTNTLKIAELEKIIGKVPEKKVAILKNPVSMEPSVYRAIDRAQARQKLGIPANQKAIVYAGQLYDWKGVDTVVRAMEHVGSPDTILHVVGGLGDDLARVKAIANDLVVFHGQRPAEEVPYWLRAATVVVVPNSGKHEISARDTDPMKLYEALAAESALIVRDLPSLREHLDASEARYFVDSDEPTDWAAAIDGIVSDEALIETMRRSASVYPLLTPKQRAERLIAFFVRLV